MAILMKIEKLPGLGDCKLNGFDKGEWFVLDSFSFGVEREIKESGEKSGTTDINIGVGELQECSVSKSMDSASPYLAQVAISGSSLGTSEIVFVETGGGVSAVTGKPVVYLWYKMARTFVKSWSISGDADDRPTEEVAFLYNKICFKYASTADGKTFKSLSHNFMGWDNVTGMKWHDPDSQMVCEGSNAFKV